MNILVVGAGAREHTIVWKLLQSSRVRDVYVAPGNAGTAVIARNREVAADNIEGLVRTARQNDIDLTIVGPEIPLAEGIVDAFQAAHLPIFGPTRAAAQIEASKAFAKELMQRNGIPCAQGASFNNYEAALAYVTEMGVPIVVKADGLAAGKGVTVCFSYEEAQEALQSALVRRTFGTAGAKVVLEEYLEGPEVSLLAFSDGHTVIPMAPAADYKRAYDDDQGPNTGGMGAYSPPPYFGPAQIEEARRTILDPAIRALAEEGSPFVGVLYAGLMVTNRGLRVIEFNCRFGDPETQVVLPRLSTDLLTVVEACVQGRLDTVTLDWDSQACVGVVMASEGYPAEYKTGFPITGLDQLADGIRVFHAGTASQPMRGNSGLRRLWATDLPGTTVAEQLSGEIQTAGGRVLTLVAMGQTVEEARQRVYQNIDHIRFEGAFYRRDIGIPSPAAAMLQSDLGALPPPGQTSS